MYRVIANCYFPPVVPEQVQYGSKVSHPLLALRALIHECEEVEVRRVRLGLAGLDQPTDVAVDPGSGAALDHISLVCVGTIPQLLWSRPHSPPLVEIREEIFTEDAELGKTTV